MRTESPPHTILCDTTQITELFEKQEAKTKQEERELVGGGKGRNTVEGMFCGTVWCGVQIAVQYWTHMNYLVEPNQPFADFLCAYVSQTCSLFAG